MSSFFASSSNSTTAVLLLSCRDQKGLVAGVSDFIARHGGNIVHADQHTDFEKGIFLQRVEWQLKGFGVPREGIAEAFRPFAERFGMTWDIRFSDNVPRVALFVTKPPHCLYDLLSRWKMGEFRADFSLVVSNHEDLRGAAEEFGLEYRVFAGGGDPAKRDRDILYILKEKKIDLVVLARYMQVLGPELTRAYQGRIINIHHSFLPAFAGARPYHQAHERGVKVIGATAHYATEDLDQGPIIEQDVARVSHRDKVEDLLLKGRDLEKLVLARAVKYHLAHRVLVYGNKTVVFD